MKQTKKLLAMVALSIWFGCAEAPYTGRQQLMLVSEPEEAVLGEEAYRQILRGSVVLSEDAGAKESEANAIVRRVGERIARAAGKPEYNWEFRIINDPETANAFCVPGGKVAVYTGLFPVARDEAGLAVILGHEVAHALERHAGERMSQAQLVGAGMAVAGASGLNPQILQALGLGANVGLILPFGRSQESEADQVGLMLMAKAGYDPRAALQVWERMGKKEQGAPPEFLSTHPGYETRIEQLTAWMPEALGHYQPDRVTNELLPSAESLDSVTAKAERLLLRRAQAVDKRAADRHGEKAVVDTLGRALQRHPDLIFRERRDLGLSYGQYTVLRGITSLGKLSLQRVLTDYRRGANWVEITERNRTNLPELISWMGDFLRLTAGVPIQPQQQPVPPRLRPR
jgi:predicted Zn-dependent protease